MLGSESEPGAEKSETPYGVSTASRLFAGLLLSFSVAVLCRSWIVLIILFFNEILVFYWLNTFLALDYVRFQSRDLDVANFSSTAQRIRTRT